MGMEEKMDGWLEAKKNKNIRAKCIHKGKDSCLEEHKQELLQFIFENRKQGMAVSINMVVLRAAQLAEEFSLLQSALTILHKVLNFVTPWIVHLPYSQFPTGTTSLCAEASDHAVFVHPNELVAIGGVFRVNNHLHHSPEHGFAGYELHLAKDLVLYQSLNLTLDMSLLTALSTPIGQCSLGCFQSWHGNGGFVSMQR